MMIVLIIMMMMVMIDPSACVFVPILPVTLSQETKHTAVLTDSAWGSVNISCMALRQLSGCEARSCTICSSFQEASTTTPRNDDADVGDDDDDDSNSGSAYS